MAKAILVMDKSKCCRGCKLHEMSGNFDKILCVPAQKSVDKFAEEIPSWCPLKPMPEKREEKYAKDVGLRDSGFVDGWNACIDTICGKE